MLTTSGQRRRRRVVAALLQIVRVLESAKLDSLVRTPLRRHDGVCTRTPQRLAFARPARVQKRKSGHKMGATRN